MIRNPMFALSLIVILTGSLKAETISSSFDVDLDGWTATGVSLAHQASGGNPGGFLQGEDVPFTSLIYAPGKFLGDLSAFNGGALSFDHLAISGPTSPPANSGRVTITGQGGLMATSIVVDPPLTIGIWKSGQVSLEASAWGVSESDWTTILSDVTEMSVVIDTSDQGGGELSGFDNFAITSVPEPRTLLLALGAVVCGLWLVPTLTRSGRPAAKTPPQVHRAPQLPRWNRLR